MGNPTEITVDVIEIEGVEHEVTSEIFEYLQEKERHFELLRSKLLEWYNEQSTEGDSNLFDFIKAEIVIPTKIY